MINCANTYRAIFGLPDIVPVYPGSCKDNVDPYVTLPLKLKKKHKHNNGKK